MGDLRRKHLLIPLMSALVTILNNATNERLKRRHSRGLGALMRRRLARRGFQALWKLHAHAAAMRQFTEGGVQVDRNVLPVSQCHETIRLPGPKTSVSEVKIPKVASLSGRLQKKLARARARSKKSSDESGSARAPFVLNWENVLHGYLYSSPIFDVDSRRDMLKRGVHRTYVHPPMLPGNDVIYTFSTHPLTPLYTSVEDGEKKIKEGIFFRGKNLACHWETMRERTVRTKVEKHRIRTRRRGESGI